MTKTNRAIDSAVFTEKWMIDSDWGLQQLLKYHEDLAIADSHGISSLNYKELKAAIEPKIFFGGGKSSDFYTGAIQDFNGSDAIAVLTLEGVMRVEDGLCSYGVDTLVNDLNKAFNHPGIKGIVLKINSGGGATTAGALLRSGLTNPPKPVVGLSYLMASGALYGTLPIKHILATDPMSLVGSIGVVYQINKKVAEWYKENVDDIYATKSFEKNEGWNAYLRGDRSIFERDADSMATIFGNAVTENRVLSGEQAKKALTGKLFTAAEALTLNLISGYGNLNDAITLVNSLADQQEQNTSSNMKLNSKFVSLLNTFIPGLALSEGATAEDAETALSNATVPNVSELQATINDLQASMDTVNATLTQQQNTITELTARMTTAENNFVTVNQTLAGVATSAQLEELRANVAEVENAAAANLGKTTKQTKAINNGNPLQSVEQFTQKLESAAVEGESKY